jgi:hypothetical protein
MLCAPARGTDFACAAHWPPLPVSLALAGGRTTLAHAAHQLSGLVSPVATVLHPPAAATAEARATDELCAEDLAHFVASSSTRTSSIHPSKVILR